MPTMPTASLTPKKTMSPTNKTSIDRVAVIGLGFVGLPLGATLADVGFEVTGIDNSPEVIKTLQGGKAHFVENGLQTLLDGHLNKRLNITSELEPGAHDVYIIAVGTPVDPETHDPILDYLKSGSHTAGKAIKKDSLVIIRSTVPVGSTREIIVPILEEESGLKAEKDFQVVFAPERLIAGRALKELRELPQIIGGIDRESYERAARLFEKMTATIIDAGSLEAAEMAKIIDNTYRDLIFSYANQMAMLCEKIGLDMTKLVQVVNPGYLRNHIPLPSPGVGGTCLTKDPYILLNVGKKYGYIPELARVARQVNESIPVHVAEKAVRLLKKAKKDPANCTVFILGFAFKGKPETSDTRDSPTNILINELAKTGCKLIGYDPAVPAEEIEALGVTATGIEEGFENADAAIIMTNHTEFEALNIFQLLPKMKSPGVFIDGWHIFNPDDLRAMPNILYGGVGND
jgi:UDP-N-acetyl-D-mannosaminuronic acid dehydrogenase